MKPPPLAVFFSGLPGSGKTTIAHRAIEALGENCSLISSEEVRKQQRLEDLLQTSSRLRLQMHIAEKIKTVAISRHVEHIVVDTNLLEAAGRLTVTSALSDVQMAKVLVCPHADSEVLFERVQAKFGRQQFYNDGQFDASMIIDKAVAIADPLFRDEASAYDAVISYRSDTGQIKTWSNPSGALEGNLDYLATTFFSGLCRIFPLRNNWTYSLPGNGTYGSMA